MGISVQCRSRYPGTEKRSVSVHKFEKARVPCKLFGLIPHGAIVVDGGDVIRCFLIPLDHLQTIVRGKSRQFLMSERFLKERRDDPEVRFFELALHRYRWGGPTGGRRWKVGLWRPEH